MKNLLSYFLVAALGCPFLANAHVGVMPYLGLNASGNRIVDNAPATVIPKGGIYLQPKVQQHFYLQMGALYSTYTAGDLLITTVELPLYLLVKTGKPWQTRFVAGGGGLVTFESMPGRRMTGAGLLAGVEFSKGIVIMAGYHSAGGKTTIRYDHGFFQYNLGVGYVINKKNEKNHRPK